VTVGHQAGGGAQEGPAIDLDAVLAAAGSVEDPEIRRTLASMDLMDGAEADESGHVTVTYHLTSPLCPSQWAVHIGMEVRRAVLAVPGVRGCSVNIQDHFIAADISKLVNESEVVSA
jgi:metal-sulfur cluster biosynthetic enzyme